MTLRIFIELVEGPQRTAIRRALRGTRGIRLVSGAGDADVVVRESSAIRADRSDALMMDARVPAVPALPSIPELQGDALTSREREVLLLLASGHGNAQIALALHVSRSTVKFHLRAIYAKLAVHTRTEAVAAGIRLGLIAL